MKKQFIFINILFLVLLQSCEKSPKATRLSGNALGTTFHIKYFDENNYAKEIDSTINAINASLSTYHKNSLISKINKGDTTIIVDKMFKDVYTISNKVYQESNGYFDPTVGVLVNAWGFGPEQELNNLTKKTIDSLMQYVGFDKIKLINNKIIKANKDIYIDFNADAKGYAIDRIAVLFNQKSIKNYIIELGGEILVKGKNIASANAWTVAIDNPNQKETNKLIAQVQLHDEAMATSGNYRKFKIDKKTGNKYVHTINAKTGYAQQTDILSASVIVKDCGTADAYATTFMALGLEKSKVLLANHPKIAAYLIYIENGKTKIFATKGFRERLVK
jgi:thiamine biosynthesis lipoprotein